MSKFISAKTVGSFVPTLTKKAFEKHGFAAATLLTDWEMIVGRELASYTAPERLKWPRIYSEADPDQARPGGTLHLRVDPARALDVEYRARQIAERINAYFGYRAVETVRLIQAPLDEKRRPSAQERLPRQPAPSSPSPDDPLAAALARMQANVEKRKR